MADVAAVLGRARSQGLRVLTDQGRLTVDPDGDDDAAIDPETLALTDPDDATLLWSGQCQVRPMTAQDLPIAPGVTDTFGRYVARLPYDAPAPARDVTTWLTLTVSADSALVDVPLRVESTVLDSLGVFRKFLLVATT